MREYLFTMTQGQAATIAESDSPISELTMGNPAFYKIRVRGNLDNSWSDKMSGLKIETSTDASMTVITGPLSDQAALSGILNTLYDLQLPVISVEHLPQVK